MQERRHNKHKNNYNLKKIDTKSWLIFSGLVILCITVIVAGFYLIPQIKLNGEQVVTLNYKQKYKEKGFTAKHKSKDVSDKVEVSGEVNPNKLGTYEITYTYKGWFKKKIVRKVEVKDISKPVLEVSDDKKIYLCPGSKFKDDKVKATDNYDGDLTDKVEVKTTKDKVIYSVSDSSGNKTVVEKTLIYEDKEAPVISLIGSNQTYAFLGEEYTDPGYKAVDNCEGDITDEVRVTSEIDNLKGGNYEVKYEVSDKSGNKSSIVRTVVVSERGKPGTIYLTFDDGPQSGTTNVILDILKEEGIEATFFITNKGSDELIKRMYDEGHTIGLHTASHDYSRVYASVDSYFNDLNTVNERVKRITGDYSYIIRFPGGSSNTISRRYQVGIMSTLTNEVVNRGYKYYDWNISSGDAAGGRPTPEMIKNNVVNSLRKDRVNMVLMHDIKPYTRDALRDIIRYGKSNGYTFEKITMNTQMIKQRVNN